MSGTILRVHSRYTYLLPPIDLSRTCRCRYTRDPTICDTMYIIYVISGQNFCLLLIRARRRETVDFFYFLFFIFFFASFYNEPNFLINTPSFTARQIFHSFLALFFFFCFLLILIKSSSSTDGR